MKGAPPRFWYPHDYNPDVKGWSPPDWRNLDVVLASLPRPYVPRNTVLQLLIASDGWVAAGCVEKSSGDVRFDAGALHAFVEKGHFRPPHLKNGDAVQAWVTVGAMSTPVGQ